MKNQFKIKELESLPIPPQINNKFQYLVWKFLKNPEKVNWPKEIKLGKILFKKYKKVDFWKGLELGFKLNSLAFFLTKEGKYILFNEVRKRKFKIKEILHVKLEEEKLGEDFVSKGNKKHQFLNFKIYK